MKAATSISLLLVASLLICAASCRKSEQRKFPWLLYSCPTREGLNLEPDSKCHLVAGFLERDTCERVREKRDWGCEKLSLTPACRTCLKENSFPLGRTLACETKASELGYGICSQKELD